MNHIKHYSYLYHDCIFGACDIYEVRRYQSDFLLCFFSNCFCGFLEFKKLKVVYQIWKVFQLIKLNGKIFTMVISMFLFIFILFLFNLTFVVFFIGLGCFFIIFLFLFVFFRLFFIFYFVFIFIFFGFSFSFGIFFNFF